MKKDSLNEIFWNNRYLDRKTGWDLGIISPPIKKWFETQKNKDLKILVPGAGKGHEVKYGFKNGFKNIHYLDLSTEAILSFKKNCPNFPKEKILTNDFFELNKDVFFDVIIEQTFFCAIDPLLREKYVEKTHQILKEKGCIIGLLFSKEFENEGPPFGSSHEEYINLFSKKFNIKKLDKSNCSAYSRKEIEFWIEMIKI